MTDYAKFFDGILNERQVKLNEPMSRHTTYGIGGPADASVHGQRLLGQTHAEIIDHRGLAGNKDQAQGRPNQIFNPFHRTNYLRSHMTQFSLSSPSY